MTHDELTSDLTTLSGSLRATKYTAEADLQTARRALASSLAAGLPADRLATFRTVSNTAATPEIQNIARESLARTGADASLAFMRNTPVLSQLDPSIPEWARGMLTTTLGPFEHDNGSLVWVDLIRAVKATPVSFGAAAPFGVLPVRQLGRATPGQISLGPGSVWIAARLVAPTAPAGAWTGFRIKGGTLRASSISLVDGKVQVQGGECTLTADLDPPAPPPALTGPGVDASRAEVDLPAKITIHIKPAGAEITALSNYGATLYGQSVPVQSQPRIPLYSDPAKEIFVTGTPDLGAGVKFNFSSVGSDVWRPSGSASVATAAWALPVAVTTIDKLGEAAGAGAVAMSFGAGISGTWVGSVKAIPFGLLILQAAPGVIGALAVLSAAEQQTYQLWDERELPSGRVSKSTLDFAAVKGSQLTYATAVVGGQGSEQLNILGIVRVHADRPVLVDGRRLPFAGGGAMVIFENSSGTFLFVEAVAAINADRFISIALENVIARSLAPSLVFLAGKLNGTSVEDGAFLFFFPLRQLLPMLPDPYVASFAAPVAALGVLTASVIWSEPRRPHMQFAVQVGAAQVPINLLAIGDLEFRLVDVSSNIDQMGVTWFPKQLADTVVQNMALAAPGNAVALFTISEISWEPMFSADPIPTAPADGVPSSVSVASVQLTPIIPKKLLEAQIAAVKGGAPVTIGTALPFGLTAAIGNPGGGSTPTVSRFELNQPDFAAEPEPMTGGLQIVIAPPRAAATDAQFPGATEIAGPYGTAVLSSDVAAIFKGQFSINGGVPVRRYDLSGYGASVFSEWARSAEGAAIIKAQFGVFVGRTAHELIDAQSVIYPWGIKVVRSIIIDRRSGGGVVRKDTGWQAATSGEFKFFSLPASAVHPGPIKGVFNVRRIRDNGDQFTRGGVLYVPVLFDGDFQLDPRNKIVAGGFGGTFTPSHDIVGYIQLGPFEPATLPSGQVVKVCKPVNRVELGALFKEEGHPIGGPVACTVDIGSAGQRMIGTRVDVSAAFDAAGNTFVVPALRGAPVLPRDGSWSVGQKKGGAPPVALDPQIAVPLVQSNADPKTWHLADPTDILNLGDPTKIQVQYGLLQATGTQKLFFARPQIPQAGTVPTPVLRIPDPPHLADVGALLNATGIFPDLGAALQFPNPQDLRLGGENSFTIAPPPFPVNAPPKKLLDFNIVQIVLDYKDKDGNPTKCTVKIDPAANPRWSITLEGLSFILVSPFGGQNDPILKVVGSVIADANSAPTLKDLNVVYGSILSLVQEIFSRLQEIAKFLPGGQKGAGLSVHFSDGKLTIHDSFALPTLPLGLGEISDVSLDLGASMQLSPKSLAFTAGIASPEKPFHWLVSLLSGTGCIQVGFQDDKTTLLIQAGLGVGLEINLAIASGSASIVIALQVDNTVDPFEVKAILTGQASVDVLDGLASASITLSAGLGIVPKIVNPPEITLIGSVAVGIHISICWVIDIDFDAYWQFSQTLKSPVSLPLP